MSGLRETARIVGVDHSYLSRLARQKRVPRNADGSFDPDLVRKAIASTTDPALVRLKGVGREVVTGAPSPPVTAMDCVSTVTGDPGERLALRFGLALFQKVGAIASMAAINAGADVRTAFALHDLITMDFASLVEDTASAMGMPVQGLRFSFETVDEPDWSAVAKSCNEPVDPKAWFAWLTDRTRLLDEADTVHYLQGA